MTIEPEIASRKIETTNKIKFKYEAGKAINEITINYNHKFGKN
jgi:hypothetical protein